MKLSAFNSVKRYKYEEYFKYSTAKIGLPKDNKKHEFSILDFIDFNF